MVELVRAMTVEPGIVHVARNLRARIVEVLQLVADKEAQLRYQADAPHVQVSNEIFNQWEDYYRPDTEEVQMVFAPDEQRALLDFNSVFDAVCEETPQVMPPIAEFVETAAWARYQNAAIDALKVLHRRSVP